MSLPHPLLVGLPVAAAIVWLVGMANGSMGRRGSAFWLGASGFLLTMFAISLNSVYRDWISLSAAIDSLAYAEGASAMAYAEAAREAQSALFWGAPGLAVWTGWLGVFAFKALVAYTTSTPKSRKVADRFQEPDTWV